MADETVTTPAYQEVFTALVADLKAERDRMVDKMLEYGVTGIDKTMTFTQLIPLIYQKG